MIATGRFVFLHLHKSGGTFVNECLMRLLPGARHLGYHLPRRLVPQALAHLPVLGLVRNPWSYYVSWHSFQASRPQPNALYRILSEEGRLDFEGTIRNLLGLSEGGESLERLLRALPAAYTNRGLNLPGPALAPIRGSGVGFYTYLYRYLYEGGSSPLHIGRMERLREELPAMLEAVGQPVSAAMLAFIREEAPRNVSEHRPYPDCYSPALRDLVAARDAEIIARHGYRFGD